MIILSIVLLLLSLFFLIYDILLSNKILKEVEGWQDNCPSVSRSICTFTLLVRSSNKSLIAYGFLVIFIVLNFNKIFEIL